MTTDPTPEQTPRQEALDEARMSIIEHLAELRTRLIYSIIAVFVGVIACWFFRDQIFTFLKQPLLMAAPEGQIELSNIHHKDLAEPVFAMLKTALVGGIFATSPFTLYQLWKFISPGLYSHEKKIAIPFVVLATLFFFGGAAFCYYFVLPYGFKFLMMFGLEVSSTPQLMMSEYLSLVTKLLLVFGVVFELPILSMFLSAMGVIDHNTLLRHWRAAVIGSFVAGALLTPADPMTQVLLAVPLCVLYFISIGVAFFFARKRKEKEERVMKELDELGE
ncbi:twin-arginine translocase subunit TatC [Persicimonas caeni]|uniref:Sec-independent protein translocase protein TatC n=1 Tax=Persicimonas caeni TaxID=2292766 RepID=A0A4Y6PU46_PERCE|nr:twin-arginine translocase subunit TatC [Persicimonas caeni]QDG51818.1 twin-arginine translocase subunit TatC [Persicimonas caeni]QED33039.1 twin-arginine translocase subunit TatC [Persicimonas caeni]